LSLVVSTIGRPEQLRRLVGSLLEQRGVADPFELIVVDQSDDNSCGSLLAQENPPLRWRAIRTEPGVSLGRNIGAELASGQVLAFPDDDCWYHPRTVATASALTQLLGDEAIVSGRLVTADGQPSMLRWPSQPRSLNRRDIWRAAISPTLFIPRRVFTAAGGFDEGLGVGASTPWQAAEETDLLLRAMSAGLEVRYSPTIQVYSADPRAECGDGFATKMRGYGQGVGRVLARNRYPRGYPAWLAARKSIAAGWRLLRGQRELARADLAWASGMWFGYRTRTPV